MPVMTKCHYDPLENDMKMIVVIRDVNNLVKADFAAGNDVIEVFFDANRDGNVDLEADDLVGGKCGINKEDNELTYFKV